MSRDKRARKSARFSRENFTLEFREAKTCTVSSPGEKSSSTKFSLPWADRTGPCRRRSVWAIAPDPGTIDDFSDPVPSAHGLPSPTGENLATANSSVIFRKTVRSSQVFAARLARPKIFKIFKTWLLCTDFGKFSYSQTCTEILPFANARKLNSKFAKISRFFTNSRTGTIIIPILSVSVFYKKVHFLSKMQLFAFLTKSALFCKKLTRLK